MEQAWENAVSLSKAFHALGALFPFSAMQLHEKSK